MKSTSESPPSYEDELTSSWLDSSKNGYASVPMEELSAVPSSNQRESTETISAASLGLEASNGV